jgi:osmotically-inducible protein OsmY
VPRRPSNLALAALALVAGVTAGPAALAASARSIRAADTARAVEPVLHDAMLAFDVRAALLEQLGERSLDVDVSAAGGVVRLAGRVADSELRSRAVWCAREVNGVTAVEDAIDVAPGEDDVAPPTAHDAADALLEARIKVRLLRMLGPRAFRLAVEARAGEVWIGGRIPSKDDKRLVVEAALRVPGVHEIADAVEVDRAISR